MSLLCDTSLNTTTILASSLPYFVHGTLPFPHLHYIYIQGILLTHLSKAAYSNSFTNRRRSQPRRARLGGGGDRTRNLPDLTSQPAVPPELLLPTAVPLPNINRIVPAPPLENGEWAIVHRPARKRIDKRYSPDDLEYQEIYYNLIIKRKPLFYIINVILPCSLISSLVVLAYFLPAQGQS